MFTCLFVCLLVCFSLLFVCLCVPGLSYRKGVELSEDFRRSALELPSPEAHLTQDCRQVSE